MVSRRYWTRELGSAPDAVGRTLRIRGTAYTIVGVAPAPFSGMVPILAPEMWIPVSASLDVEPVGMHDAVPSPTGTTRLDRRADRWLFMRGRLKPGVTLDQARANLVVLASRLSADNPATIGVSKMPGAIAITRMPKRASSRAMGSVMPATPAFDAL